MKTCAVALIREFGGGDSAFATQGQRFAADLFELCVDECVEARQKQARDRHDSRHIAAGGVPTLKAAHVGLGYGIGLGEGEYEHDVDADSGFDELLNRLDARVSGRHLDEHIGPVHRRFQAQARRQRAGSVVCQCRRDLQADVAAAAAAVAILRQEQVACLLYVGNDQGFVACFGAQRGFFQCGELVFVVAPARNGLVKDRRVGGDPGDAVLRDEAREMALSEQGAGKVVEPDLLAVLAYLEQRIHRCTWVCMGGRKGRFVAASALGRRAPIVP